MTVLVDAAVWEWRGARWAHLVSDESYDELQMDVREIIHITIANNIFYFYDVTYDRSESIFYHRQVLFLL